MHGGVLRRDALNLQSMPTAKRTWKLPQGLAECIAWDGERDVSRGGVLHRRKPHELLS